MYFLSMVHTVTKIILIWLENTCDANFSRQITKSSSRFNDLTIFIFFSGCTNIFLEHGSYGNQDCVDAINDLQKYLTSNVPLTIFEHLAEDRNSCTRNHNPLIIWSKDQRIKLGLFLHPSIRKFTVDNKGNELMLSQVRFQPIPNVWIHFFLPIM